MKITDIEIELDGIYGTITNYTKNPYVVGYLNSLRKSVKTQNVTMIKMCIDKLLEWYKSNYETIMGSPYVFNKEDHASTMKLLQKIACEFDK